MTIKQVKKAFAKNKKVYWNDPDELASGDYRVKSIDEEENTATLFDGHATFEVDVKDLD